MNTKKYKVESGLLHNGKEYAKGAPVELSDEQAKPLIALKVISAIQGKAPSNDPPPTGAGNQNNDGNPANQTPAAGSGTENDNPPNDGSDKE